MFLNNFVTIIADGVYSDQYTTYQEAGSLDSVVQVPFFKLVKKLNEQRFGFQIPRNSIYSFF